MITGKMQQLKKMKICRRRLFDIMDIKNNAVQQAH